MTGDEPSGDAPAGWGKLGRRETMLGLLAATAGCSGLFDRRPDGGDGDVWTPPVGPDVASRPLDQVHVASRRRGLPRPGETPAVGITNEGIFGYTDPERGWEAFTVGTDEVPVPGGTFGLLDAARQNRTVFASERLEAFPSIQEALSLVADGVDDADDSDGTGGYRSLVVIGGENVVDATIEMPQVGVGIDARESVSIVTQGGSYLKQADGAELDAIIRSEGAVGTVDVNIDGNQPNNETPVTGIEWQGEAGHSTVRANLFDCARGLAVVGNTETSKFDVYVSGCGVGVVEARQGQYTPDENLFVVRGHGNDGPFYRKNDAQISTDLLLGVEDCPGDAVVLREGSTTVRGVIRTAGRNGVTVTGGDVVLDGLTIISCGRDGVVFDGGRGRAMATTVNNVRRGFVVGETRVTDNVKIVHPNVINVREYAVEFRRGRGHSLRDPQSIDAGDETGDAVAVATGGETSAYVELASTHVGKPVHVGDEPASLELKWLGGVRNSMLERIPDAVEGMWGYNSDDGNLNIHDGEGWILPDGTRKDVQPNE